MGVLLLSALFAPGPRKLCEGFLPENDLKIPVRESLLGLVDQGIDEAQFNEVLDRVEEIYSPIVAERGGHLKIQRLWTDESVNAGARRSDGLWIVKMFGGLARHPAITQDGFALVACHEIGHHVGGAPKKIHRSWSSAEGQSDYFANLKCLRRVFSDAGAAGFTRPASTNPLVRRKCAEKYETASGRALCERTSIAGMSVSTLFLAISRGPKVSPRFDKPDPNVVDSTNRSHPATQCRLDTFFSGALCPKPVSEDVHGRDPAPGTCTRAEGYSRAARPRCWYRPPDFEPRLHLVTNRLNTSLPTDSRMPAAFRREGSVFAALRRRAVHSP